MPRVPRPLLALAFGGVVAFGLLELGLRALRFSFPKFCRADVEVGHRLRPGAAGWCRDEGDAYMAVNALGMRDRERSVARTPGVKRVALLGDSFMEARQVAYEDTLGALLERELAARGVPAEVFNFGCTGYTTGQELLFLKHYLPPFQPDLVLVAFFAGNDVPENIRTPHSDPIRPYHRLEGGKLVLDAGFRRTRYQQRDASPVFQAFYALSDHLRTLQLVAERMAGASRTGTGPPTLGADPTGAIGPDDPAWVEPRDDEWRSAWAVTDAILAEMAAESRRQGARLAVFAVPASHDGHPDDRRARALMKFFGAADVDYPRRHLTPVLGGLGVPFHWLAPAFREAARRDRAYLNGFARTRCEGRGHWNEAGHRVAAQALAPWLAGLLNER